MKLWLDDLREPPKHGCLGFTWAKTADQAIEYLKTGIVTFASLDHDLAWVHQPGADVQEADSMEQTGYSVVCWMELNNVWPIDGVAVHSMNIVGKARMLAVIQNKYGRTF